MAYRNTANDNAITRGDIDLRQSGRGMGPISGALEDLPNPSLPGRDALDPKLHPHRVIDLGIDIEPELSIDQGDPIYGTPTMPFRDIDFGIGRTFTLPTVTPGTLTPREFPSLEPKHVPIITSNDAIAVAENTSAVTTVTATDQDGDALVYAITGGADQALFSIDPVTGALSFITAPDYEAPADADGDNSYVVQVSVSDGFATDARTIMVQVTNMIDAGDAVAPLDGVLWHHDNGRVATADHDLGAMPSAWQIAGTGDFDGDGDADILWRQDNGTTVVWELQGGQHVADHSLPDAPMSMAMSAAADFDRDGDTDLVWRDGNAVVMWEMEDGSQVANHVLPDVPAAWQIAGTGDFDADGDADILWRNGSSTVTWEMEDGAYVVNHNLPAVNNSWSVAATGDLDNDGDADIVWRHDAGQVVSWEMENGARVATHSLGTLASTWEIAGARDFDQDGDADILMRHDSGQVQTWEMQQGALASVQDYGAVANVWHIKAVGEFDM